MKKEDVEPYINKRIHLILKNGYRYTGTVISVSEGSCKFIDKYNKNNTFDLGEIVSISEVGEE